MKVKKEEIIIIRPRIYLPKKYATIVELFKVRVKKKTLISLFLERVLEELLSDKEKNDWERVIKEFVERVKKTKGKIDFGKKIDESANKTNIEDERYIEEEFKEEQVEVSIEDILL